MIGRGRIVWPTVALLITASAFTVAPLHGQARRDSLLAAATAEFDAKRRIQLLVSALDPSIGAPDSSWTTSVQLLAQALIDEGQDAVAAAWLRWALRLSPGIQPDTVRLLPTVLTAYHAAREFVRQTTAPQDSVVATNWIWPVFGGGHETGRVQIAASALPGSAQIAVEGIGTTRVGAPLEAGPGSYVMLAWAAGYDSVRVTREVLPGIITMLHPNLHLIPPRAPVVPSVAQRSPKHFPWLIAALGAAGAGGVVALLAGGGGGGGGSKNTGGIIINFPAP
jgi:hypothetical protein